MDIFAKVLIGMAIIFALTSIEVKADDKVSLCDIIKNTAVINGTVVNITCKTGDGFYQMKLTTSKHSITYLEFTRDYNIILDNLEENLWKVVFGHEDDLLLNEIKATNL